MTLPYEPPDLTLEEPRRLFSEAGSDLPA